MEPVIARLVWKLVSHSFCYLSTVPLSSTSICPQQENQLGIGETNKKKEINSDQPDSAPYAEHPK
jgi:hypothetical protein